MIKIDPTSFTPLYEQVKAGLKREIALGTFAPHEPLPSIRELAGDLLINPNTVARAYGELERELLIYSRKGKGCFVSEDFQAVITKGRPVDLERLFDVSVKEALATGASADEIRKAFDDSLLAAFKTPRNRSAS